MSVQLPCGPTFTAEVAFSAATGPPYGVWDAALWNTATWGPDAVYQDISPYVRSFTTSRRFSRDVREWESGTASTVLSNRDRRFSPDNLSGPYVVAGVTGIRPWRPYRLRAGWAGVTYDIYNGYALSYQEDWAAAHADATVTVQASDELARLSLFDGLEVPPVGAGETAGRRIHRILDNAGHTGVRCVDVGRNTMQATTLSSNAVAEMRLTTDSEGGALYVDADGCLEFEQQYALIEDTRSNTIQATFGDGTGTELGCADIAAEYDGSLVVNMAAFARVGGSAQTAADNISRALYGDRRATRTDLICETDVQASALATFEVEQFKAPELRITQVTVRPQADPTRLWPQVLGRRVRDLVRVVLRPIGGGTITRDCHISGIHHASNGEEWTTTFDLSSATVYQSFAASRWDVGSWDSSAWFF